jgi:hypothetical protein
MGRMTTHIIHIYIIIYIYEMENNPAWAMFETTDQISGEEPS